MDVETLTSIITDYMTEPQYIGDRMVRAADARMDLGVITVVDLDGKTFKITVTEA